MPRAPPPLAPEGPAPRLGAWPGPDLGARFSAPSRSRSRHRSKGDGGARSCASTTARTRAATETGAVRARFAGARVVPAAAPSRATSPHGAGGKRASALSPGRFGNEGDNALGRLGGCASSWGSSAKDAVRVSRGGDAASPPSPTVDHPWRTPQGAMGTVPPSARRRFAVSFYDSASLALGTRQGKCAEEIPSSKLRNRNASFTEKILGSRPKVRRLGRFVSGTSLAEAISPATQANETLAVSIRRTRVFEKRRGWRCRRRRLSRAQSDDDTRARQART